MNDSIECTSKIPITIITGLLGSGKTTLLRKILNDNHGLRIAVLLNEYAPDDKFNQLEKPMFVGENGNLYEEWIEVNNGCLCCSAKGQTIRALESLTKHSQINYVIVESSGLANPGPIINSLWLDEGLNSRFKLNGVVTIVDACRLYRTGQNASLEFENEFTVQLIYADHIIVNKMDLLQSRFGISKQCKQLCHDNIFKRNPWATCSFTQYCDIDIKSGVLNLCGYEDYELIRSKMSSLSTLLNKDHSDSTKNIRCFTIDCPPNTYFKRQKLNELLTELLWNNQEDQTVEGKYGRIRRLKASVIVEEEVYEDLKTVIVQAVDDNYDEFELMNNTINEVSRFVFIGDNMRKRQLDQMISEHISIKNSFEEK
ncbi:hypothetical protein GJ496_001145 [Pomphorhynchus laevis]|nr:hypothetical protein GJ496_001145 [Pomphorhynchus laevis]